MRQSPTSPGSLHYIDKPKLLLVIAPNARRGHSLTVPRPKYSTPLVMVPYTEVIGFVSTVLFHRPALVLPSPHIGACFLEID